MLSRLVTPITALLLVVLGVVCLCYRGVVAAYPVSGGSHVVSRDNFGYATPQIPGAALLCSYTLTVAVSVAAGVDAVLSAFPGLRVSPTLLALVFVLLLTYGNLRGIREAGRVFAVPTYWFLISMAVLIVVALVRQVVDGGLPHVAPHSGQLTLHPAGSGLLLGASLFLVLRGFANGGSAMTGMEAISNAVTVFRAPQVANARRTLVLMAAIIGALFLAVSGIAALAHAVPTITGTPTVLSELGELVFGPSGTGRVAYYSLQLSTALILILGANTSFNGFPLLVSFIAQDSYLPRPLTTRGHRLVYSNGVIALAALSGVLLVVTRANVASLIPLYATTVFTGFTMAGAGMTRYHLKRRDEPGRRRGLVVNGTALVVSGLVTLIFVITEFSRGAWAVVVVIPLLVLLLSRTHRRYEREKRVLAKEVAPVVAKAPILPRQATIVLVDRVDLATARGLQLARSVAGGARIRAVHFSVDDERTARLVNAWSGMGLDAVTLEDDDAAPLGGQEALRWYERFASGRQHGRPPGRGPAAGRVRRRHRPPVGGRREVQMSSGAQDWPVETGVFELGDLPSNGAGSHLRRVGAESGLLPHGAVPPARQRRPRQLPSRPVGGRVRGARRRQPLRRGGHVVRSGHQRQRRPFRGLRAIRARVLLMPGETDLYFRVADNEAELPHLAHGKLAVIPGVFGHRAGSPQGLPEEHEFLRRNVQRWLAT